MEKIIYIIEEGPVKILSNNGKGIKETYNIWYGMTCSEYFPNVNGSANYVVKISQAVSNSNEVDFAKENIEDLIRRLEWVWVLAGGGKMKELQKTEIKENSIPNNVEEVREKLLEREGFTAFTAVRSFPIGTIGTYNRFPLEYAIKLVELAHPHKHPELNELYKHFHVGMSDNPLWFSELYKIKDDMKRILKNERKPFKKLQFVDYVEVDKRFEEILSKERHAPKRGEESSLRISTREKAEVRGIARDLVEAYIRHIGHGDLLITRPAT